MSTTERGTEADTDAPRAYAAYPEYELSCVIDDADRPTEVTVFPEDDVAEVYTQWISIDEEHAIPLEETL